MMLEMTVAIWPVAVAAMPGSKEARSPFCAGSGTAESAVPQLVSGMAKVVRVRFWPGFRYLPAASGKGKERKGGGFCAMCIDFVHCFVFVLSCIQQAICFCCTKQCDVFVLFLEACYNNDIEGTAYLQYSTLFLCDFST